MMRVAIAKWMVAAAVVLLMTACHKKEDEDLATPVVVTVKTAKAEAETLQIAVKAPATIFPRQKAEIAARITAPIRTIPVRKGDEVKANQVLAILDGREIDTFVQTWDYLQRQQAELHANLSKAESEAKRLKASPGPLDAERARALDQANNQASSITIQQLPQNEAQLRILEIRSPFSGSITEQFLYPGDMAKPDVPILTLMEVSVVIGRAQVSEASVGQIRKGMPCQFISGPGGAERATGHVIMINKALDLQRRAVEVWCEIPNSGYKLRPGTFGEIRIATGQLKGVMVPETAVQSLVGARSGFVIVVNASKTHRREVDIGESEDGKVQILKGLKAGEVVVTEGGYGLPDDVTVTLTAAGDKRTEEGDKADKDSKRP